MNEYNNNKMSKEQLGDYVDAGLLTVGTGSYGIYHYFKSLSEWCSDLLPILSVVSFGIYLLLNGKKIIDTVKSWFGKS